MPKSKQQKQQEAIERKRNNLGRYRVAWRNAFIDLQQWERAFSQSDAPDDFKLSMKLGAAQDRFDAANKRLKAAAQEAKCDTHGNPL